jgi:ABC-type multidrug transport system permease subunit
VALVVGGAGLAVTLQLLGPQTRELLPRLWPVLLILVGLMALLRALLGRRS